jgi:hypothetical protein
LILMQSPLALFVLVIKEIRMIIASCSFSIEERQVSRQLSTFREHMTNFSEHLDHPFRFSASFHYSIMETPSLSLGGCRSPQLSRIPQHIVIQEAEQVIFE